MPSSAPSIHQRGELRDRTGEGQHYRVAGLNLLAAIIIMVPTTATVLTMRLEDLRPNSAVRGVHPDGMVTVVSVQWFGSTALELTCKTPTGTVANELLYRHDEARLEVIAEGRPWSFDGDGALFRLVSEAQRICLAHLFDPLLAVHTSVVDPLPHQITGVYEAMLPRQPLRFLLADDPGAGKTIMAGLLIKELIARGDLERCLIVCPGSLAEQWQDELYRRFQLPFEILTNDKLEAARTRNWFLETDLVIARLDKLSRDEDVQQKLQAPDAGWDLVVCDEAHKLSATFFGGEVKYTKRYRLGQLLSGLTRHFLLMTATPHNGKEQDFQLFLALLDGDRFEGRFRDGVHKADVSDLMRRMVKERLLKFDGKPLFPERIAYTVPYRLSDEEAHLYTAVTDYVREEFNRAEALANAKRAGTVGFALTILQRRLASSPEAIYQSLRRRRERLESRLRELEVLQRGGQPSPVIAFTAPELDADDVEDLDDAPEQEVEDAEARILDQATAARSIVELKAELETLKALEDLALGVRRRGPDTKWRELASLLGEIFTATGRDGRTGELATRDAAGAIPRPTSSPHQKLVVFTEHRDTLRYLQERITTLLGRQTSVVVIHGSVGREDRLAAQEAFRHDPQVQVLLATDAAGEGINLQRLDFPEGLFDDVPAHRITRLRRQRERYFADGLRELPENRRLAILAVCAVEWEMFLADAVVETHDRVVGRTYRTAVRTCEAQLGNETVAVRAALRSFADLGSALLDARDTGAALDAVIATRPGWEGLGDLVATAAALANTVASDPLNHMLAGYSRFRRYTPRMLRTLDIEASPVARPLLEAVDVLRNDATARPTGFLRPNSKWSRLLRTNPITACGRRRCCSTCATRSAPATSGWRGRAATETSERRCCRLLPSLMPTAACRSRPVRTIGSPSAGSPWTRACAGWPPQRGPVRSLAGASKTACSASRGRKPPCRTGPLTWSPSSTGGCPRRGSPTSCSRWTTPPGSPRPSRTCEPGEPCRDRIGLLNVLLAEGINLGLRKIGRGDDHARVLGVDAHRPLACGRRRVRPSVGRRRRGPGRATDGRLLGDRADRLEPVLQRGRRAVNFRLIAEQWDRVGQFYAAFPAGHATASAALQRLNRFQASNRFYAANRELGRALKTDFVLQYMSEPKLRAKVRRGLLEVEQLLALGPIEPARARTGGCRRGDERPCGGCVDERRGAVQKTKGPAPHEGCRAPDSVPPDSLSSPAGTARCRSGSYEPRASLALPWLVASVAQDEPLHH